MEDRQETVIHERERIIKSVVNNGYLKQVIKQHNSKYHDDVLTKVIELFKFYLWKFAMLKTTDFYYDKTEFNIYETIFNRLYNTGLLIE